MDITAQANVVVYANQTYQPSGFPLHSANAFYVRIDPFDFSVCGKNVLYGGKRPIRCMQALGQKYPRADYGGHFQRWLTAKNPKPYNSFGKGAAMRISACGYASGSTEEAKTLANAMTKVSHNHP